MKAKADARHEADGNFSTSGSGLPIRWAGQQNRKQDVCNAGWQQQIAVKASAESKISEKESGEQVVEEQRANCSRVSTTLSRPARYCHRQNSKAGDAGHGDAAAGKFGTQKQAGDQLTRYDILINEIPVARPKVGA